MRERLGVLRPEAHILAGTSQAWVRLKEGARVFERDYQVGGGVAKGEFGGVGEVGAWGLGGWERGGEWREREDGKDGEDWEEVKKA